uniref:Uncharacterized protein n=1 Tax=Zea mays TaxID=4577 RepID=B6T5K2_MAIZE|nr:hypothetical protein [Zea mays]
MAATRRLSCLLLAVLLAGVAAATAFDEAAAAGFGLDRQLLRNMSLVGFFSLFFSPFLQASRFGVCFLASFVCGSESL